MGGWLGVHGYKPSYRTPTTCSFSPRDTIPRWGRLASPTGHGRPRSSFRPSSLQRLIGLLRVLWLAKLLLPRCRGWIGSFCAAPDVDGWGPRRFARRRWTPLSSSLQRCTWDVPCPTKLNAALAIHGFDVV